MLREEWRLQKAFVGSIGSAFFPAMIFLFALILALASPVFLDNIPTETILLILHIGAALYGLSVGALAHIGQMVMTRRLGQVNVLIELSQLYPVSYRRVMAVFYVKEVIYYVLYSVVPLIGGIAIAAPFAGLSAGGVALLAATIFMTFMLGMSLSFVLSSAAVRSRAAAAGAGLVLGVLVLLVWPLGYLEPGELILPLGIWQGGGLLYAGLSAGLILLLSVLAVATLRPIPTAPVRTYRSRLLDDERRFGFAGDLKTLVAKEWLELRRSGSLEPVITGFLGPLLAVFVLVWIIESGMDMDMPFNLVFYSGIVGFLGMMTYSWLNNVEPNDFLNVQPVSVSTVVKAKQVLFFLLTSAVATGYLAAIAVINGELELLGLALLVAFSTTTYVVAVTAWLTGLRTNTMLLDAGVLSRFSGAILPPLIAIMLLSFGLEDSVWIAGGLLVALSGILMGVGIGILRRIPKRWEKDSFSF